MRQAYPQILVDKVLRVRDMYNWCIANPDAKDRQFAEQELSRYDISKVVAYSDLDYQGSAPDACHCKPGFSSLALQ